MAGNDASRADLFALLEQSIGRETATALMDHIPPAGWPDFATKADVALLKSELTSGLTSEFKSELVRVEERLGRRIDSRVELSEHRVLAAVDRRLRAQTWIMTTALLAGLGLAFTAGRIG